MTNQTHSYVTYYLDWFNALHNAKLLTDMKGVHDKGVVFMNILNELWHYDLLAIEIVERYGNEIVTATRKKENTFYN